MLRSVKKRISFLKHGFTRLYSQYFAVLDRRKYGNIGIHSIIANDSNLIPENMFVDDYCVIQSGINFISNRGKLYVGKYSVISSGCIIIPGSHKLTVGVPFYFSTVNHLNDEEGDVIIEEDCWIGAGCILLPKCHIGRGVVVGAGCLVNNDIPPYAVVVGVPAKIIATKFSIEEIIKHESIIYPPEERMTKMELEQLFSNRYQGLYSIGVDNLSIEDIEILKNK